MSLRPDDAQARRRPPGGTDRLARVLWAGLRFTEQAQVTGVIEGANPIFRSLPSELWNVVMEQLAIADGACTSVPELCGILKVLLKALRPQEDFLGVCNSPEFWKAACEHRGWTFDSADYAPPIKEGDNQDLARWRGQYLLFCSTSDGLANELHRALYAKLLSEACETVRGLYQETYGGQFYKVMDHEDLLNEEFSAFYEFQRIKRNAVASISHEGAIKEVYELYTEVDPDNRDNGVYQPSSPMYSPTAPPYELDGAEYTTPAQLPAGYTDKANATFGSIVNTVGDCANWAIDITIDTVWTDKEDMFEDMLAFDPSVRHIRYLVSMIRNVAMVGAKHVVRMHENRPERPDPLNPLDVLAWQKHSDRYTQVVAEFRKIVMETPATFNRITYETFTNRREQVDMNKITERMGTTLGLKGVDEERTNFTLIRRRG